MQEELSFGTWLRKQRRALDLSRQAFADQVGCAEVTLRRIEAGTLKPSKDLANILLEKLGISQTEQPQWVSFARGLSGFPSQSIPSSNKPKSNLPAPLTTFIGRENEQAEVIKLVARHRLVTLTGPGGVGKTRLSIKVGEQVLGNYADGVWMVELAPILDPLLVPRTTAIAIGLRDEPQRPVIDMLSDYLREKRMLIVLDNCEHLLDACVQLSDMLLHRCPGLKILVTSREALGILGEAQYHVPSLEVPDNQQVVEKFRTFESVRLFEERAQLVRMGFSLTIENVSSVAEICNRLDGIPLAIELAAARVSIFSAEQIAMRLRENFSFLTTGNRTALPRHQTLRAAIDWSYDLLSPAEKSVFQRLSVFVNGWTLEAAESVCSDSHLKSEALLDLLTKLTNKSLVVSQEGHGRTRYRMLETIRQYAIEKLIEAGESELLRDRHLEYFLKLAETADPHLIRPEQIEWLSLLDAEHENLHLALEWTLSKESAEPALNLCRSLLWFWAIRPYRLEGLNWVERALAKSSQPKSRNEKVAHARALYVRATFEWMLGNIEQVLSSAQASLALALEVSDQRDIAIARFYVGAALQDIGADIDQARSFLEQSLTDFQRLNEAFWEAQCFPIFGQGLAQEAKLKFQDLFLRWLELARKAEERSTLADALSYYADWLFRMDREQEAKEHAEESNWLYQQIGSEDTSANSRLFAEIAWASGDTQKARLLFTHLYERFSLLGDKIQASLFKSKLGTLAIEEGDLDRARIDIEQALVLARESGIKPYIANRLIELSKVFYLQGNIEAFQQDVRETFALQNDFVDFQKTYILLCILDSIYLQNPENSAQLLGVYNHREKEYDYAPRAVEKQHYARAEAHARRILGDDAFESAFVKGQEMSLDEALDLALKTVQEM